MPSQRQEKIWSYFQSENPQVFRGAKPRLDYLVRRAKRILPGGASILTIGIGDGYLERRLRQEGLRATALDPDIRAVEALIDQGISGAVGFAQAIPFDSRSFDLVIASEVLEHLDAEQGAAALTEIERVLTPGGWFLGTVPYAEDLGTGQVICPSCGTVFHRWGHHRAFNCGALKHELLGTFATARVRRMAFVAFRGRSVIGKAKSAARWILGRLGEQIAAPSVLFEARAAGRLTYD